MVIVIEIDVAKGPSRDYRNDSFNPQSFRPAPRSQRVTRKPQLTVYGALRTLAANLPCLAQ